MVLLIELRRLIATLPPGAVVHLIATDPAAPLDLPAWCHLTGHTYLGPVPGERPTYAVEVAAGAQTHRRRASVAPGSAVDRRRLAGMTETGHIPKETAGIKEGGQLTPLSA